MKKPALPHIKICGLRTEDDVSHVIEAGARWMGFVHFEKSPRHVSLEEAEQLIAHAKSQSPHVETVVLLVNPAPEDAVQIADQIGVDHIQLHGQETNDTIRAIRAKRPTGEIWKALPISTQDDLKQTSDFPAADRFLFDAKPPKDADRPGGWGHSFDWTLLADFKSDRPWLLAGGLTPENVAEAVRISGAQAVDVSSGVEKEKGVKDRALIESFAKEAHPA